MVETMHKYDLSNTVRSIAGWIKLKNVFTTVYQKHFTSVHVHMITGIKQICCTNDACMSCDIIRMSADLTLLLYLYRCNTKTKAQHTAIWPSC